MNVEQERPSERATRIARGIMDELPRIGGHVGVSPRVLVLLVLLEPAPRTVVEIRNALGIARATASEIVREAEVAGLVRCSRRAAPAWPSKRKRTDGNDARQTVVVLTARGKRMRMLRRGGA